MYCYFLFAVILAKHVPQPFSFFSGCCGVLYLWIGYFARKNNVIEKLSSVNVLVIIALLLLSGYSISLGELNLSACKFPGGILTFITSIVITFSVLYILSKNLFTNIIAGMPFASVVPGLARGGILSLIGRNTLYLLVGNQVICYLNFHLNASDYFSNLPFGIIGNFAAEAVFDFLITLLIAYTIKKLKIL